MKIDFARELALRILYQIETETGYSNLVLDEYLDKERQKLSQKDINLISELVYGTITWKLTLDTIVSKYSKIKINKISNWILMILRMGIYQIVFLDKIPKSAAVNESVNLCKKYGFKSANFVNAILRKVEKSDYEELFCIADTIERISKVYSMPQWLVEELSKEYDNQTLEEICKNSNLKPKVTIRVNTLKTTIEELKTKLEERDIPYEESKISGFLHLKKVKNISNLDLFKEGLFTVQDEGAGEISIILDPKEGESILDVCSAPGGKTTHIAQLVKDKGNIMAWDLYAHRLKLVEENTKRLGIKSIQTQEKDATILYSEYIEKFDKILLDVPCLGFGVMKRKPDIKWQRKKEDIQEITKVQLQILENCSKYLKVGGELVYSTCSILKSENQDIVNLFLKKQNVEKSQINKEFKQEMEKIILPDQNTDGFYICKLSRNA